MSNCSRCARRKRQLGRRWTAFEESCIIDSARAGRTIEEAAATISGLCGVTRTPAAIAQRIPRLRGTVDDVDDTAWLNFMMTYQYRIPTEIELARALMGRVNELLADIQP